MKISISIVTYNSEDDIGGVLSCIEKSDCFQDLTVYVSDNDSKDGTVKFVNNNYPFVTVIQNERNGGYGYGHNKVIELVNSDIHFIINPDIRFDSTLISKISAFLISSKDVVICTPEMITEEGQYVFPPKDQPKIHYIVGRFFNKVKSFEKWREDYTMKEKVINNEGKPFDISFCSGAFMAIKTDILRKVNGFDDRYFLYYEDADLTRKLLKFGRCLCIPTLSIVHEGKREAYHSSKLRRIMISSMAKYFVKWGIKI